MDTGQAFIAMVCLLVGLVFVFSASTNQTSTAYTKQVLKL